MWFTTATSDDRLIASEPFSDLPGVWHEIDESSAVLVPSGGVLEHEPFRPQVPRATLSRRNSSRALDESLHEVERRLVPPRASRCRS